MLYNEPFNFKPISTITPMNSFWQNSTWKFGIPKITCGGSSEPTWQDVVISGLGSVTLVNAKANGLNYVKLFGGCEQNGTPTPSTPVDIVCNNGTLKLRHQSGLPLEYQPYEYLTANGNKWLNTGVKLASTDIVETEFKNSSSSGYGALYGVFALGDSSAFYANGTYYGYDVTNDKVNTGISVDTEWHTLRQDFGNGVITLDSNDTTYTPFEFENTKDNYLFARYYNNSYGYGFKGSCKRYKVIRNGVLICDLIPVVQLSDNAVGMYDLVNNVFRGNLGTGDFDISNPINDLEIYVDGTVETVEVDTTGDTATAEPLLAVGDYKDVQEVLTGAVTRNVGIKVLDGTENWRKTSSSSKYCSLTKTDTTGFPNAITTSFNVICTHAIGTDYNVQGSCSFGANNFNFNYKDSANDLEDFKQFLADQYNSGNPVVIVYPLATATTESVTPQPLSIQAGTNIIEITQASISGIEYIVDTTKMTYTNATMSDDYVMTTTNNSSSGAITSDVLPLNTANTWEWRTKFTYTSSGTYGTVIGHNNSNFKGAPYIQIVNGEAGIQARGIGIVIPVDNLHYVTPADNYSKAIDVNTPYYLKFGFSGTEYYLELNTEGWDAPFTRYCTYQSTAKCYVVTNTKTEFMNRYTGSQVVGSMDFKETRLYINGDVYWEYVTAQGKELELEVSYKAGVEVTIEEIEAVNNDNQVEVTING